MNGMILQVAESVTAHSPPKMLAPNVRFFCFNNDDGQGHLSRLQLGRYVSTPMSVITTDLLAFAHSYSHFPISSSWWVGAFDPHAPVQDTSQGFFATSTSTEENLVESKLGHLFDLPIPLCLLYAGKNFQYNSAEQPRHVEGDGM